MNVPDDYIQWGGDPAASTPPQAPVTIATARPATPPEQPRRTAVIVAATAVVTLLVAAVAVVAVLHLRTSPVTPPGARVTAFSGSSSTSSPTSSSSPPPASTPSSAQPSSVRPSSVHPAPPRPQKSAPAAASADAVALTRLNLVRDTDAAQVRSDLNGRWVPLLAAKNAGIKDPLQRTAKGGHVFGWADILAEHERLRGDPRLVGSVLLTRSTDYGKRHLYHGKPLYVTFADLAFASAAEVRAWCDETFPELGSALRRDSCSPGLLTPPR